MQNILDFLTASNNNTAVDSKPASISMFSGSGNSPQRQMIAEMLLGAAKNMSGSGSIGAALGRGFTGAGEVGLTKMKQQKENELYAPLYKQLTGVDVPQGFNIDKDMFKTSIDFQNALSSAEFNKARASYYKSPQGKGSSMFYGSKDPFLIAFDFMNDPDKFGALTPEAQDELMNYIHSKGKGFDYTYGTEYNKVKGGNKAKIEDSNTIEFKKSTGKAAGELQYAGPIEAAKANAKAGVELGTAGAIEEAKLAAKQRQADIDEYKNMTSKMPTLTETVNKLNDLAETATYTKFGQMSDELKRQLGLPVGDGAVARTEYTAIISNQILPLLRDTFGAQFTEREGETLRQSLGDVNKSPAEKQAVLSAFITQKENNIKAMYSKLNGGNSPSTLKTQSPIKAGQTIGRFKIVKVH